MRRRSALTEPVFASVEQDMGSRRWTVRGLDKVRTLGAAVHRAQPEEAVPTVSDGPPRREGKFQATTHRGILPTTGRCGPTSALATLPARPALAPYRAQLAPERLSSETASRGEGN
jgi:hypothetical protein